jgi:hypothetical protein
MESTTTKSTVIMAQRNPVRINGMIPTSLKDAMVKACKKMNVNESQLIKLALVEKLERENFL